MADLKDILKLESAAFRKDAFTADMFWKLYHEYPDFFLIARSQGVIVGYIVACVRGQNAEIISIAVDPAHRRHGIGKALMTRALAKLKAQGVQCVRLTVRPANLAAIRLYSILGFQRVRRILQYYADSGDALQMRKIFGPQVGPACTGNASRPASQR